MQLQPNSPQIGDTLGLILVKKGDTKGALLVLEQAHAVAPANGEISYHLALVLNSLGRKADAKQVIRAALAQDRNFAGASDAEKLLKSL
jgi:Flp pilus assembly protein TadD